MAEHKLTGPQRYREYKLRKLAEGLCPTCQAEERERQLAEAARRNREEGLPPLVGTEAQVAWAEHIRREALDGLAKFIDDEEFGEQVAACLDYLMKETRASWWINYRHIAKVNHPRAQRWDVENVVLQMKDAGVLSDKEPSKAVSAPPEAVKAEATIRPAEPKTNTVAEIRTVGNAIEVEFPERREDFRQLIRYELGFTWTGTRWKRTISPAIGPVEERVVETAHKLLAAGFPIRLYDAELRRRAIEADFTPEPKRIIAKRTSGQYAGWFAIVWPWDEDYYRAARGLPGSKWDKPAVVVPPEHWEAVLGFAETYDFVLLPGAQELVEQARSAQEAALVAPPMEPKRAPKGRQPSQTPPKLEVPVEVDIDDSLRDDDD